jgi:hemolysin activation/secretion protein
MAMTTVRSAGLTALTTLLFLGRAFAQTAPVPGNVLPGAVQPGRDRALPQPPAEPDFDFSIETPGRSAVSRSVDEVSFTLKDIRITGAKTIDPAEFSKLYAKLLGKQVKLSDILDIADQIEQLYRDQGYLLVRAYVPPQRVRDGVFTINVVEGHIEHSTIQGGTPQTQDQVKAYLDKNVGVTPPLLTDVERSLLLANDVPGISASGVLRPSDTAAGGSDIVVNIDQPPVTGGIGINNRGSRYSGLWSVNGDVEANGLLGPDQLLAAVTTATSFDQQSVGQMSYRSAIGDDGLLGSLTGTITRGQPGSLLTPFDIRTDSWAIGPRLTFPLIRSRLQSLQLDGGFTVQDATVDVLGSGFSHDKWRVLDAGLTYSSLRWLQGAWSATLDIAQGLPILGATPNHDAGLSRTGGVTDFTKLTTQLHYTAALGGDYSLVLSSLDQFSFVPLITGEQISFGGLGVGRGYDPSAITGDHGASGSLELRRDFALTDFIVQAVQPYVYAETARTWYIQRGLAIDPNLVGRGLTSIGLGARAALPHNLSLGVELAQTLAGVPGSDNGHEATKGFLTLSARF